MVDPVAWQTGGADDLLPGKLRLIDQTLLPNDLTYVELDDVEAVRDAIKRLVVRGAPAIGCAAALGLAAAAQHVATDSADAFIAAAEDMAERLGSSRPTAVNLRWALARCLRRVRSVAGEGASVDRLKRVLVEEGLAILEEDKALCRAIGESGLSLFDGRSGVGVITHCNAGGLATSGFGTALAPVYAAQEAGLGPVVFADETRPLLQGARLTAWELQRAGVDVTVICDSMAGALMRQRDIGLVIVGADRIAANGDVANKIGTYGLAILADRHDVPFYVAAPYSTIDMTLKTGDGIPIEQREPDEVRRGFGKLTAPETVKVWNPAFDVTPAELIHGIITEKGILGPPFRDAIAGFIGGRTRDT